MLFPFFIQYGRRHIWLQQRSIAICNPILVKIFNKKKLDVYKGVDVLGINQFIKMEPDKMQGF